MTIATNHYFNNFPGVVTPEQLLAEDLIIESIKQYGTDVFYVPRKSLSTEDGIYGEDPVKLYDAAYTMEMYMQNVAGFEGPGEFFSKFGLEIRDSMRAVVARRTYEKYVPVSSYPRPREGDLVYVPAFANLYEIKYVEEERNFYTLGRRPPLFFFYELSMELYKFSNERFSTGVKEIDDVGRAYSYTQNMAMIAGGTGAYKKEEIVYQGSSLSSATSTAIVKNWFPANNMLQLINIKGTFSTGSNIVGSTSNANFTLTTFNRQDFDGVSDELTNNLEIQTDANDVVDFSETNP
ncbi:MAG: hypothetical protein EBU21_12885, partial [Proteobacteria bacterium]|nr:hypothetical protein [Pseudomonadota bacterium]